MMDTENTTLENENTQNTEKIKLDDKVIKKIVATAVTEVDGLLGTSGSFLGGITGILQKSTGMDDESTRGIATETKDGFVTVSIKIITEMGKSIPAIADNVTQRVTEALRSVAGLQTKTVNVEVVDTMTREEYEEKNTKHQPKAAEENTEEASK